MGLQMESLNALCPDHQAVIHSIQQVGDGTQDGELERALPRPPSCEYNTTFDALQLTRWDTANGARA